MANEVKVTISAEDKTKAGIKKANAGLKQLKENAKIAARGIAEFGAATVAVLLGIERAFKAVNELAGKMGRTDVTAQYAEMNASIELSVEAITSATDALDGFKAAWYGIEYAARLTALLIIKGMGEAQIAVIDATGQLGDFGEKLKVLAIGLKIMGRLSDEEYRVVDGLLGMSDAEQEAAKEAIRLKMAHDAYGLTAEGVAARLDDLNRVVSKNASTHKAAAAAIDLNRKAWIDLEAARKKGGALNQAKKDEPAIAQGILDIARGAARALADAEKQKAATLAQIDADSADQRAAIAQDYQDQVKEISKQGGEDIENAIRGGDALALAQALKGRQKDLQVAQTDHDKKLAEQNKSEGKARADANSAYTQALADQKAAQADEIQSLRMSLTTIETLQAASQAAQLLGIGTFFTQAQAAYNAGWAGIASGASGGSNGGKTMAPRAPVPASSPRAPTPIYTPQPPQTGTTPGGPLRVVVTVGGDDAVRAIVRNVFVQEMMAV